MGTEGNKGRTKKEVHNGELQQAFDKLSAAFFPPKHSLCFLEEDISGEDVFQLERWHWEGGAQFL